jgi:ABC-type transport system substrate-binding protein
MLTERVRIGRSTAKLVSVLLAAVLVAACGGSETANDDGSEAGDNGASATTSTTLEPAAGGTLSFGLTLESIGWLPSSSLWDPPGYVAASSFFDRLTAYDADGNIRPYLAESIEPNEDFTEYTITLREGVEFHDSTPLDAEALKVHFENMVASPIWGPAVTPIDELEVVDDLTLRVVMSEPFSTFPHVLSAQPGFVAAPSQYEDPDGQRNPVGTGPFVFEEWVLDDHLTVRRNENYWRDGYPLLDGIVFRPIPDSTERRRALETGDLDMMETNAAADIADLEESGDYRVYLDSEGETTEMTAMLNSARLPFEDPVAREAVAHAIDREAIAQEVYGGRFEAANGLFRPGSPWYQEDVAWAAYDPELAAELAAEYEAEYGEPISFVIEISTDPFELKVAQSIEEQAEAVGMEVEIKSVPAQQTTIDVAVGAFDMNVTNLLFGSPHPDRESFVLQSANSAPLDEIAMNIVRMEDPEIDASIEAGRTTDDLDQQIAAWRTIQERLAEQNTFIYLVHNETGEIASTRVQSVTDWTFPDGTEGRNQDQTILSLYQLWLQQ